MKLPEERHLVPFEMTVVNWHSLSAEVGRLSLSKVLCYVWGDVSPTAWETSLDVNMWAAPIVLSVLMFCSHSGPSMWTRGLEYHAYQVNPSLAVSLVQALIKLSWCNEQAKKPVWPCVAG